MSTDAITRDIVINASPETVYDVVSRPEHIAKWFADEVSFEPVPDARGVLIWRNDGTEMTTVEVTVVSADRPHLFSFHWVSPERQKETPPTSTDPVLVEFRIMAEAEGTRLVVSESGLDAVAWDEQAKAAYAADHTNGWGTFMPKLRDYAEGLGRGAA